MSEIPYPSLPGNFVPRNLGDYCGKIVQHHVFPIGMFEEVDEVSVWLVLSIFMWTGVLSVKKLYDFYCRLLREMFKEDVGIFGGESEKAKNKDKVKIGEQKATNKASDKSKAMTKNKQK